MEDPLAASAVAVYPNPSEGAVTLRLAGPFTGPVVIHLLDVTGKLLRSETIRATAGLQHTVSLQSLPPGLYLLRVTGGQRGGRQKIISR